MQPCLNVTFSGVEDKLSNLYPLEFDRLEPYCEDEKDVRYTKMSDNYTVTLFDLQKDNGIHDIIEQLPLWEKYVDTDNKTNSE